MVNYLIESNDKYIHRYPEEDFVQILKDSGYHSEEWKEMDPEEDWPIIQPAVVEDGITLEEEIRKKLLSLCIYERWWHFSAVCIFIILLFLFY